MAYERKDNSGAMFANRKKEKDTHPDMTGDALIGGTEYYVSAWEKTDKNGATYYSFSFKDKASVQSRHPQPSRQQAAPASADGLDDSIPF